MVKVLMIAAIAAMVNKSEEEITLPNGKVVNSLNWKPAELPEVFKAVSGWYQAEGLGKSDLVVLDGGAPIWLVVAISHALHPVAVSVNYPQGNCQLPVTGVQVGAGGAEGVNFNVKVDDVTVVEMALEGEIDAIKALSTLEAPEVEHGKPVHLTGRSLSAIYGGLADAYAHKVPYVAVFQPGTGFVVAVSHDSNFPLGTVVQ